MKYAGTALAALVVLGFAGCSQNFFHGQKDTTAPSSGLEESLVPPVQSDHNQLNSLQADKVTTDAIVVLRPDFDPSVYRYSVYAYNSDENGKISITVTPGTHATSTIFLSTDDGLQYNETASGTAIPVNDLGRWEIKTLNLMVRPDDPLALPCAYTITVYGAPEWEYSNVIAAGTNPPYYTWQAPITGLYKIECWGAEGGKGNAGRAPAGKGGYSYGTIALVKDEELFVTIGGKGGNGNGGTVGAGGVNGGGKSGTSKNYKRYGGGGGGASDVRYNGTDLQQRIIVAGGGGGAGGGDTGHSNWYNNKGGDGGGGGRGNGGNGFNRNNQEGVTLGAAWNDAGDAHVYGIETGIGQTGGYRDSGYETPGGGGGGYYGGQATQIVGGSGDAFGGGGGSSFINTGLLTLWGGAPGKRSGNGLIRISWLGYVVNQTP